jgi:hypothetical protein
MVKLPDPRLNAGEHTPATLPRPTTETIGAEPALNPNIRGGQLNKSGPKIPLVKK